MRINPCLIFFLFVALPVAPFFFTARCLLCFLYFFLLYVDLDLYTGFVFCLLWNGIVGMVAGDCTLQGNYVGVND